MRDAFEGSSYVSLNVRQGLDILGASETGGALLSRANGSSEFSKAYVTLTRQQRLSENWSVVVSGAAQAASTALLASEEFYLGGPLFGRAFRGGDVSGDAGVASFAEARFDQSWEGVFVKGYQVYAFVDTGAVWDRASATITSPCRRSAADCGYCCKMASGRVSKSPCRSVTTRPRATMASRLYSSRCPVLQELLRRILSFLPSN